MGLGGKEFTWDGRLRLRGRVIYHLLLGLVLTKMEVQGSVCVCAYK